MYLISKYANTPAWLRPSCWRWLGCHEILLTRRCGGPLPKGMDKTCRNLFRFLQEQKKVTKDIDHYLKKWPEITMAYQIFLHNGRRGWRWVVEACLLSGASYAEIVEALALPELTENVLKEYAKVFFDVMDLRDNEAALNSCVFAFTDTSLNHMGMCDYSWKKFAIRFGLEDFLLKISPKSEVHRDEWTDWEKEVVINDMTSNSLHIPENIMQGYTEDAVNLLNIVRELWNVRKDEIDMKEAEARITHLQNLRDNVHLMVMSEAPESGTEKRRGYRTAGSLKDKTE